MCKIVKSILESALSEVRQLGDTRPTLSGDSPKRRRTFSDSKTKFALARVHATKRDLSPVGQMLQSPAQRAFECMHLVTVYNSSRPATLASCCSAALYNTLQERVDLWLFQTKVF